MKGHRRRLRVAVVKGAELVLKRQLHHLASVAANRPRDDWAAYPGEAVGRPNGSARQAEATDIQRICNEIVAAQQLRRRVLALVGAVPCLMVGLATLEA
jgi:hypothetical protein